MTKDKEPKPSEILLYTSPQGDVKVEVFFKDETVWLTQKKISELFGVSIPTVNEHLNRQPGGLDDDSLLLRRGRARWLLSRCVRGRESQHSRHDGKNCVVRHVNLAGPANDPKLRPEIRLTTVAC